MTEQAVFKYEVNNKFDLQDYKVDQKFRKSWSKFISWWTILADKRGNSKSISKIIDINGWVLFYWEHLSPAQRKQLYKENKNIILQILNNKGYNIPKVFIKDEDNKCFIEELKLWKVY